MAESAPWWQIVHERFKENGISVVVHVPDPALIGPIGAYGTAPRSHESRSVLDR